MLALMLYAEARRAARRDAAGAYVPLEQQDTSLWDDSQIALAEAPAARGQRRPAPPAATSSKPRSSPPTSRAASPASPNWPASSRSTTTCSRCTRSPVVALNRAVALAEVEGPDAALAAIAPLAADKRMPSYQPYWAARGHLLAARRPARPTPPRPSPSPSASPPTTPCAATCEGQLAALAGRLDAAAWHPRRARIAAMTQPARDRSPAETSADVDRSRGRHTSRRIGRARRSSTATQSHLSSLTRHRAVLSKPHTVVDHHRPLGRASTIDSPSCRARAAEPAAPHRRHSSCRPMRPASLRSPEPDLQDDRHIRARASRSPRLPTGIAAAAPEISCPAMSNMPPGWQRHSACRPRSPRCAWPFDRLRPAAKRSMA